MNNELNMATPINGASIDSTGLSADIHMPGLGLMGELMDSLSSPTADAPIAKASKLDHTPPVPGMGGPRIPGM